MKLNPSGGTPFLALSNGQLISESLAICEYLDETQDGPKLVGATPEERAETRMYVRRLDQAIVVPMTNGDNPGLALGVASGTVMGPRRHLTAAFTVLIHGMPATRVTSVSLSNSTNCPGARMVPSQVGVVLLAP